MAKAIVKFGFKSAIACSSIYWTRDCNVWGSSQATEEIYNQLWKEADPYLNQVKSKISFELPALPSSGEVRFIMHHYYNSGVKGTFNFIHMLPCYLGRWAKKGQDAITKALEAPPPSAQ